MCMSPEPATSLFNGFLTFIARIIQEGCWSQWLSEYLTILLYYLTYHN